MNIDDLESAVTEEYIYSKAAQFLKDNWFILAVGVTVSLLVIRKL
jgi:hypothetical protein